MYVSTRTSTISFLYFERKYPKCSRHLSYSVDQQKKKKLHRMQQEGRRQHASTPLWPFASNYIFRLHMYCNITTSTITFLFFRFQQHLHQCQHQCQHQHQHSLLSLQYQHASALPFLFMPMRFETMPLLRQRPFVDCCDPYRCLFCLFHLRF